MREAERNRFLAYVAHIAVLAAAGLTLAAFLLPNKDGWRLESSHLGIDGYSRARFSEMVDGSAFKPFVCRALLPATTRFIATVTPEQVKIGASRFVRSHHWTHSAFKRLGWNTSMAYQFLTASLLMYICFVGFAYYCAKLAIAASRLDNNPLLLPFLALLSLYLLPPFFRYISYIYDPPQLCLYTASLYYLARLKLTRFVFFFLLTALNKETSILLIPIFAVFCWTSIPRRQYVALLILLASVHVTVRALIFRHFYYNPGNLIEFTLFDHNLSLATLLNMFSGSGYFALLLAMACWQWKQRPRFLRIALPFTLLPLIALCLFFGWIDEWRDYYEAYPVVFALAVNLFYRINPEFKKHGNVLQEEHPNVRLA
jgi:hypothetical protein